MTKFRLPNYEWTENVDEFEKGWAKIVDPIEYYLRVKVIAFDPGLLVSDNSDRSITHNLPLWLANRIIDAIDELEKE